METLTKRGIEIVETQVYRGTNYWMPVSAILYVLDIGGLKERATNRIPGFCEKLSAVLPTLGEHHCSAGGFLQHLREGMDLVHATQHVALALQTLAGQNVSYGKTHPATAPEEAEGSPTARLIFECEDSEVGLAAGRLAVRLVDSLVDPECGQGFDFQTQLAELIQLAKDLRPGIDTRKLKEEAESRGIPVIYLDENRVNFRLARGPRRRLSLMQLGHGKFQKRIWAPYVSSDSFIAAEIASNKELTSNLLRSSGLPTPRSISATDEDSAAAAAGEIGYPVVVKPLDGSQGRGVGVFLQDEAAVRAHYPLALRETRSGAVLVEEFLPGRHYRILVVGGRFVAAAERLPAHVIGDGSHTLRELVELSNSDPTRAAKHKARILFDDRAITLGQRQGYAPDDMPPCGQPVQLALTCNISTGGTSIDRTDEIHPYNLAIAEQAAQVISLDVAGIDLIAPEIAQSVRETGGAICEVNGGPGLFVIHTQPVEGHPRDVTRAVIDFMFPPGAPSRVPIVAVTGTHGTTTTSQMIAHILKLAGHRVGLATTDGIEINGLRMVRGDMSGPDSARAVLQNPTIDAAVLETSYAAILCSGLGYDCADVAVITNAQDDGAREPDLHAGHDLVRLNTVVANSTGERGVTVLNADNPDSMQIVARTHGEIILFTKQPDNEVIRRHLRAGGRALVLRPLAEGAALSLINGVETALFAVHEINPASQSRGDGELTTALAAAAACVGLGVDSEIIAHGLRRFAQHYK